MVKLTDIVAHPINKLSAEYKTGTHLNSGNFISQALIDPTFGVTVGRGFLYKTEREYLEDILRKCSLTNTEVQ